MRILIVEDQAEVIECLRSYFEGLGHLVQTAPNAEEALALIRQHQGAGSPPYDLAFVDLILPKGHGRDVIRGIDPPTRIIVVTASDDLELRKEMLALGVSEYLFKPVTVRDLEALGAGVRDERAVGP